MEPFSEEALNVRRQSWPLPEDCVASGASCRIVAVFTSQRYTTRLMMVPAFAAVRTIALFISESFPSQVTGGGAQGWAVSVCCGLALSCGNTSRAM